MASSAVISCQLFNPVFNPSSAGIFQDIIWVDNTYPIIKPILQSIHFSIEIDSVVIDSVRRCNLKSYQLQSLSLIQLSFFHQDSLFNKKKFRIVFWVQSRTSFVTHLVFSVQVSQYFPKVLGQSCFYFSSGYGHLHAARCWVPQP